MKLMFLGRMSDTLFAFGIVGFWEAIWPFQKLINFLVPKLKRYKVLQSISSNEVQYEVTY